MRLLAHELKLVLRDERPRARVLEAEVRDRRHELRRDTRRAGGDPARGRPVGGACVFALVVWVAGRRGGAEVEHHARHERC